MSYRGRFYGSDDQTNSVKALKDNSWSVHQLKGQSHQAKPQACHYGAYNDQTVITITQRKEKTTYKNVC